MNTILFENARRPIAESDTRDPHQFHQRLPAYRPTPIREARRLARQLGVSEVLVKDESSRLGLPSFKILGASWAIYRRLCELMRERAGVDLERHVDLRALAAAIEPLTPLTLAAATDGNHGRAVARMARLLGLEAHIFVPEGTTRSRIEAIRSEHAVVSVVAGTYDEAVRHAAEAPDDRWVVISDTSWPGYEQVPNWVIEGYSTIFFEIDDQFRHTNRAEPDAIVVQIGVGALAAAVARHYRRPGSVSGPLIIGVEPRRAACTLESVRAGHPITLPGPHDSIMVGLNCGTPSSVAWPYVSCAIDLFIAVDDCHARRAVKALAREGMTSGETGAAGLAGLLALHAEGSGKEVPIRFLSRTARVLIISTEGATDPLSYREIVGGQ